MGQWIHVHWFLSFLLVVPLFVMLLIALNGFCSLILSFYIRTMRTIKVVFRGWPPPHIDADGDWKPGIKGLVPTEGNKGDKHGL